MSFSIDDVRAMIEQCGLPGGDLHDLPDSPLTFPDGSHWRNEASGISNLKLLEMLIDETARRGVCVHRVIFGMAGRADQLTRGDLRDLAQMGHDGGVEIVIEPGLSAKRDVGSHAHTPGGEKAGFRLRGADQLTNEAASVLRAAEAGIRGFLLRGECSLMLLSRLREKGHLPKDVIFKASYDTGHSNPAGAALLEQLGADSFNPVSDLTPAMLATIRRACRIPMDLVVYGWPALGGISRQWDAPELVRVASPCYLKQELYEAPQAQARNCEILAEIFERACPRLQCGAARADDLRIPQP